MPLVKRRTMGIKEQAELETALVTALSGAENAEDITNALVELAEMLAAQDDAIVELAELIEEE